MKRLWDKEGGIDPRILAYTVGEDFVLDLTLIPYDCAASIAHAEGLARIGVLTKAEAKKLTGALRRIVRQWQEEKFSITPEEEDGHTAIENLLTKKLGSLGKKIHAGRSRNDQVLVCLRLLGKQRVIDTSLEALELCRLLIRLARRFQKIPMPGYTHTRQAMPTTVGHLLSSYVEALLEDLELAESAYHLNDRCPLGAAAGFGVSLPLDREYVAGRLGFDSVQANTLNAVSSRAKIQWATLTAASAFMQTLMRIAQDVIVFSDEAHGFFRLPPTVVTGSSIMPQKQNPDVFELIRAGAARTEGYVQSIRTSMQGLGSGYHRDAQITKEPFLVGTLLTIESLHVMQVALEGMEVDKKKCTDSMTAGLFAADRANELVAGGMAFRDAYRKVKEELDDTRVDPQKHVQSKTHTGAPGNIGLKALSEKVTSHSRIWKKRDARFRRALSNLLGET